MKHVLKNAGGVDEQCVESCYYFSMEEYKDVRQSIKTCVLLKRIDKNTASTLFELTHWINIAWNGEVICV